MPANYGVLLGPSQDAQAGKVDMVLAEALVLRGKLMGILDVVTERRGHRRHEVITKGVAGPRNH